MSTLHTKIQEKQFEILPHIVGFTKDAGKANKPTYIYSEMKDEFERLDSEGVKVFMPVDIYRAYQKLKNQVHKACEMMHANQKLDKEFIQATWKKRNELSGAIISYFSTFM